VRVSYGPQVGWWYQPGDKPSQLVGVPDRFTATVDDDRLPYDVELVIVGDEATETHVVESLTVQRRDGGPAVNAGDLRRIPVGALLAAAVTAASSVWTVTGEADDGTVSARRLDPHYDKPTGWTMPPRPSKRALRDAVEPKRRNAVDPLQTAAALDLYQQAKRDKRPNALQWVADQLGVARSTAHRYVKAAEREMRKR
jgi:hypothetical protein